MSADSIFNLEDYKLFLINSGDWNKVTFNIKHVSKDLIIESICQYEKKPYDILNINRLTFSSYINKIYKNVFINKVHNVAPSKYLLHIYGFRRCSVCKQILNKSYFRHDIKSWDKLKTECKICERDREIDYNKTKNGKLRSKKYRDTHKEKIKIYREENSYKINSYTAARRARLKQQLGINYNFTMENRYRKIILYLSKRYNEPYELDHYIPISKNGTHEESNWQIITKEENLHKNSIHPENFYKSEKGKWFLLNKKGIRKYNGKN